MIYQFNVQLKHTQPKVWRRLQVDSEMSFYQLHKVLQIAFEWENSHLHAFEIMKAHGKMSPRVEIGMNDEEFDLFGNETLDEKTEFVKDWFTTVKDRTLYTYDFGDDWQHDIVLEKMMEPKKGVKYPHCVKAVGLAPEEDSWGTEEERENVEPDILTAEVNGNLAPYAQEVLNNSEQTTNIWKRLLLKSKELNALKPWELIGDNEVFIVQDPVSQEYLFISVLGGAGQEYGLAVYIGEEGYRSLQLTMEQKTPLMEVIFIQRSLLLSFVDRHELEKEDYDFLKSQDVTFRGKKQWPEFRSMVPGSYPWSIDQEEARILILAIEQTNHVFQLARQEIPLPLFQQEDKIFARIPYESGQGMHWENELLHIDSIENGNSPLPVEQIVSDVEIKLAKSTAVLNSSIQFDLFYINMPVQSATGERPYFPYMAVGIDSQTGMVLHQDIFESRDAAENAQRGLLQVVERIGKLPKKLVLTAATHRLLEPVLSKLKLKAEVVSFLPEVESFKTALSQFET
ncbi:hypothetical protein BBH88_11660 [Planococcus antarcticus DSM 14505]|uniref:Uncharacterized protein n=1 Tax=Planococcus antarcticus DSM 14505 TaxID=1185653 RepID=A0ABM6D5F5_9BACL|nr:plasmid pRiA4b ORF-3 family protein [Planococcus antarcticus]ANU10918.1 hypothetical protein BBH88_11660 [Planococcus antarcticus DSM 14505]